MLSIDSIKPDQSLQPLTGATDTCDGTPLVEDLPDNKKRVVKPPITKPAEPKPDEKKELDKKDAETTKEKMTPEKKDAFKEPIKSMGVYEATAENVPDPESTVQLPIIDPELIQVFVNTIDTTQVFTSDIPYNIDSSSILMVQYQDDSFDYVHGIFDNRMLMSSDDNDNMTIFALKEEGMELLQEFMSMTRGNK